MEAPLRAAPHGDEVVRYFYAQPAAHVAHTERDADATKADFDEEAGGAPTQHVRVQWKLSGRRERSSGTFTDAFWREKLAGFGPVCHWLCVLAKQVLYITFADAACSVRLVRAARAGALPGVDPAHVHVRVWYYLAFDAPRGTLPVANDDTYDALLHSTIPANVASHVVPPIPGLVVVHNFLTPAQEHALTQDVNGRPWITTMKRRVQHYGHGFDYISRRVMGTQASSSSAPSECTGPETSGPSRVCEDVDAAVRARVPTVMELDGELHALVEQLQALGVCGDASAGARDRSLLPLRAPLVGSHAFTDWVRANRPRGDSELLHPVDQVTVNEYTAGQGIGAHIDTHDFQDGVVSVSIGGDLIMEFRWAASEPHACGRTRTSDTPGCSLCTRPVHIVLPRRSLLYICGEARYAWAHTIPPRRLDHIDGRLCMRPQARISITCRSIRGYGNPCACAWRSVCPDQHGAAMEPPTLFSPALRKLRDDTPAAADAGIRGAVSASAAIDRVAASSDSAAPSVSTATERARSKVKPPRSSAVPNEALPTLDEVACLQPPSLERQHVHALYDAIADHFSHTRHSPWPRVEKFLRELPAGSVVCDIGCGNGKYLGVSSNLVCIGMDFSAALVDVCAQRGYQAFVGDAVSLCLRDAVADATLSIAVLHHISTIPRRLAILQELLRVTRVGGLLFIQAWALEQGSDSRRAFEAQDVFVPWNLSKQFVRGVTTEPAPTSSEPSAAPSVLQRYCHVYTRGELDALLTEAAVKAGMGVVIRESWWDRDNWALIAERTS